MGVYYARVPKNAGRLRLFDPRGKGFDPTGKHSGLVDVKAMPNPPFHRTVSIRPEEGKLVIFPGWLVHSVMQPEESSTSDSQAQDDDYRVSIAINLKGEWQDSSSLHYQQNCR